MCSTPPPPFHPNSCFYSPEQPPQGAMFSLSPLRICPACRGGCGAERVLNKFLQPPDVSIPPPPKSDPPVTWCGCRGSLACVCESHRIPLPPGVWVLLCGCHVPCVSFGIMDHDSWGDWEISSHTLPSLRVDLHLSGQECFLLSHDNKVLTCA